jgi:hypothetical protein
MKVHVRPIDIDGHVELFDLEACCVHIRPISGPTLGTSDARPLVRVYVEMDRAAATDLLTRLGAELRAKEVIA